MKKGAKSTGKIQPLADRVLIRREDKESEKTATGIYIPETATKEKSKLGVVVAVGPGKVSDEGKLIPMTLKTGAKVIFNSGWDNEVDTGDEAEHFLVRESDILAVIT